MYLKKPSVLHFLRRTEGFFVSIAYARCFFSVARTAPGPASSSFT